MHDPDVVAFTIRRPWPRYDGRAVERRWKLKTPFPVIAGRRFYFPSFVTVWHHEPGGKDSGEVCRHYYRWQGPDGQWHSKMTHAWKWHVHHWKISVGPLQALRRRLLTRCAWCGGRSTKRDSVNISHSWESPPTKWWRGKPGLFHRDCSSVENAHRKCLCDDPLTRTLRHGPCLLCGKHRGSDPDDADRLLAALPRGARITDDIRPQIEALWDERRRKRTAA